MFCSPKCRNEFYRSTPKMMFLFGVCKDPNALQNSQIGGLIPKVAEKINTCKRKTIFDFDFSTDDKKLREIYKTECFLGLNTHDSDDVTPSTGDIEEFIISGYHLGLKNLFLRKNTRLMTYLEFPWKLQGEGYGTSLFVSLLNHSCDPNATIIMVNNKQVVYTLKPVKEGEQLFICYG
jgi:SET domain